MLKLMSSFSNSYSIVSQKGGIFISKAEEKILSFIDKSPFKAPSQGVVNSALEWRRRLYSSGFKDIDVFPGHSGEILLSGIFGASCFEATVECDGSTTVVYERNNQVIFSHEKLNEDEATEKLAEAVREIWILSVGSIQINSTNGRTGLQASHSRTLMAAFP